MRGGRRRESRPARAGWIRAGALGCALALGASAPGCLLPELLVDGTGPGAGGVTQVGGTSSGGQTSSGGGSGDGVGSGGAPGASGGAAPDATGGTSSGGNASGGSSGGPGTGGTGSGGAAPIFGYYESNSWHGFVGTLVAYGDIDPPSFDDTLAPPYCVSGSLDPNAGNAGIAGWTWNINQPSTCSGTDCVPTASTQVPTSEGLVLRLDNPGNSPLRVQIDGPNGAQDPSQRWCADISGQDGVLYIPWEEFNTECWEGGSGQAYAKSELARVNVLVPGPGSGDPARSFEYCVEIVGESDSPDANCELYGIPGLGSFNLAGAASANVVRKAQPYVVQGDVWGTGNGQVIAGMGTFFEVTTGASGQAGTYPAAFVGEVGGASSGSSWLPTDLFASEVVSMYMRWSGDLGPGAVALLEMRFSNATDPVSQVVQVWLGASGRTPGGNPVADFTDRGTVWKANADVIEGVPAAVFWRDTSQATFEGDLRPFAVHAAQNVSTFEAGDEFNTLLGGFQISSGGGVGLKLEDFCASSVSLSP